MRIPLHDCFDQLNRFGKGDLLAQGTKFSGHLEWPVDLYSFHKLLMQRIRSREGLR
jgi:hypothetical protein